MASTTPRYGVVIAHKEGAAVERVVMGTDSPDMATAQDHADRWTRRHGTGELGTDPCGFYAYADRITGARSPEYAPSVRTTTTRYR